VKEAKLEIQGASNKSNWRYSGTGKNMTKKRVKQMLER
jgi:hypothetical protein